MTHFAFVASITAFALLPVAMLGLRAFGPRWFTGILAFGIVALVGWGLANACIYFSFEDACEIMEAYGSNPPQNIIENCTSDGAARIFGLMFGGFYALICYAPFAFVYEIARFVRRIYRKRREQDSMPVL